MAAAGSGLAASEAEKRRLWGARIAYVAQSAAAAFNPAHKLIDQTVETAVRDGIRTRDQAVADSIDLYRRLQLPNPDRVGDRYPHQVSGGQLQRAMTAMAMSCRPDLIIFDEPTASLTPEEKLAGMAPTPKVGADGKPEMTIRMRIDLERGLIPGTTTKNPY